MEVELIAKTCPINGYSDMQVVEQAACVCYNSEPTPDYRIAKACYNSGHLSTWEHISFTFHIKGVSRALLAQLSRHRHISLSVQSQRYNVYDDGFGYVNPFMEGTVAYDFFESDISELQDNYNRYIEIGEKPENARAILPNACCTELYITANARALIEMSNLRLCTRAQAEIREMFQKMKEQVSIYSPMIANWMVPQCEKNEKYPFCPEHKSCGRHPKLSEVYKSEI